MREKFLKLLLAFIVVFSFSLMWSSTSASAQNGVCGEDKMCVFLITNVDQLVFGTDDIEGSRRCSYQGGGLCGTEGGDTPIEYIVYMGPFDNRHEANVDFCNKH